MNPIKKLSSKWNQTVKQTTMIKIKKGERKMKRLISVKNHIARIILASFMIVAFLPITAPARQKFSTAAAQEKLGGAQAKPGCLCCDCIISPFNLFFIHFTNCFMRNHAISERASTLTIK